MVDSARVSVLLKIRRAECSVRAHAWRLVAPHVELEPVQMLSAMDVERAGRDLDDTKKLEHYINVTMLFLEDEDSVSAERFLVKVRRS